ncbi:hypothetical protein [Bradyrhizobium sp. G127]|uniref:hypothetical protein n=1 Tax=Bradyrhizobium sp. G127 TaxID=2904800 RepID=UPI001F299A71|nr:hypothetical protein [Bradyrhizobium sp. G127]MCF2522213.1 hypothetical protein [Bradyrhizobium sp. G127]
MNQTTREILEKQRAQIVAKLEPMLERTRELRKELITLEGQLREMIEEFEAVDVAIKALDAKKPAAEITIMQAVLQVLEDRPEGMTAQEILSEINTRYFNGRIVRPSLSPQLSRLKDRDRKIDLRGNKWVLLPSEPTLFTAKDRRL